MGAEVEGAKGTIHQIEYRWHDLHDFSPVASSMSPQSLRDWDWIRPWVRHPSVDGLGESLCYQLQSGRAALAWRYRDPQAAEGGDGRRTRPLVSRVLVGQATLLTPEVAIALCRIGLPTAAGPRAGQVTTGTALPVVRADELTAMVREQAAGLDEDSARQEGLRQIMAAALSDPLTPLAIYVPGRRILKLPGEGPQCSLLWGLRRILWPLHGTAGRGWSFSTFEPPLRNQDPAVLPDILFRQVGDAPMTAPAVARKEITLRPFDRKPQDAGSLDTQMADRLVAEYQERGGEELGQLITEWCGTEQSPQARLRRVYEELRTSHAPARASITTDSASDAPPRIFMSYRRDETGWAAGWLFDSLANRFGRDQVFKDVDSIELGDDFVEVITTAVGSCDVFLALIGSRWLTITDEDGRRRLDNPADFVRLEIEAALERGIRVIPILVDGARMPHAHQLPESLARLARKQALKLSEDRFGSDFQRLLPALRRAITTAREQARQQAEEAAQRRHRIEQLQARLRVRAAVQDWEAVMDLSEQLTELDLSAADPDGLASTARHHISRRQLHQPGAATVSQSPLALPPVEAPDSAVEHKGTEGADRPSESGNGPLTTTSGVLSGTAGRHTTAGTGLISGAGAQTAAGRTVTAEWALWGKEAAGAGYRVLRCSKGIFSPADFESLITRYAAGAKGEFPQYTVCSTPEGNGRQGYVAVGIHELAEPDRLHSGGRVSGFEGREIENIRLFCVRYEEMAVCRASYTDLVWPVLRRQLPAGSTDPIALELLERDLPPTAAPIRALAENVATLLLTTRPVCILGAERITVGDRLQFIDHVMSLLPYGMRAALSASTWASSTSQELKLRLLYTSARRDDGASYVIWGQPGELDLSAPEQLPLRGYASWLRRAGPAGLSALAEYTAPVRFNREEIQRVFANLRPGRTAGDVLEELANDLRLRDLSAVRESLEQLMQHGGWPDPAAQLQYREAIKRLGLLRYHQGLHASTMANVYRVLLGMAFGPTITYASYQEIEDCADGSPHEALCREMLQLKFSHWLPWLLTVKAGAQFTDQELMATLDGQGIAATAPITNFERDADKMRPRDRTVAYDFAMGYLRAYANDPRAELARLGYLAKTLEVVFPHDLQAQFVRLEETLRFVYGGPLSEGQVSELHNETGLQHTSALDAAVASLSRSLEVDPSRRISHGSGAIPVASVVLALGLITIIVCVILILLHLHSLLR